MHFTKNKTKKWEKNDSRYSRNFFFFFLVFLYLYAENAITTKKKKKLFAAKYYKMRYYAETTSELGKMYVIRRKIIFTKILQHSR